MLQCSPEFCPLLLIRIEVTKRRAQLLLPYGACINPYLKRVQIGGPQALGSILGFAQILQPWLVLPWT